MEILAEAVRFLPAADRYSRGLTWNCGQKNFRHYRAERQREEYLPEMRLPRAETDNGKIYFNGKN